MGSAKPTAEQRRAVERAALAHAREHPEWGQARVAEALAAQGLKVSPAGVRYIWQRHDLATAPERAAALQSKRGARLSAAQTAALARIAARRGGRVGAEESAASRERLLAVAVREFSRKGFARTSMRDIARAAGIQAGSLYYHFASKDELFAAAHAAGMGEVLHAIETALAAVRDPWQRLETACTVHIEHLVSGNDLTVWTGAALFLFNSPELQQELKAERDRFEAVYRKLIAALPLPAGIDRRLLRLQLLGALNWTRTWYRPGKRSPAEIARHLVKVLRERMGD
ncbi:HTH-type transcriptional regulator MtrR [Burkholderiales bacterium]|nr:MAG: TetR/AcrR family transcriptional regulator [Burkholderiales bacterium]CAG1001545.1 HTH-type transcriptional regulator MtrR [Burkholderiales bacterium]